MTMKHSPLAALLRVAEQLDSGAPESMSELMSAEGVPTDVRLVVAAVALAAADRPLTKLAITQTGGTARSGAYRDQPEMLHAATTFIPSLVRAMLDRSPTGQTATELRHQLTLANESIARERARSRELEEQARHVLAYAAELHARLKLDLDVVREEQATKVRHLRPAPELER